jgi:hypothetical protein
MGMDFDDFGDENNRPLRRAKEKVVRSDEYDRRNPRQEALGSGRQIKERCLAEDDQAERQWSVND